MKKIITISSILTVSLLAFLSTENKTHGSSAGAPNGYTGAPADNGGSTCGSCHTGSAVTHTTGIISSDIPASGFIGGTTYNFLVMMSGSPAYGFEVSAQTPFSNSAVGTLIANDPNSQISGNYITHNPKKTGASASWTFQWTAPLTGTTVTIYSAFNFANNNLNDNGDEIRTSSVTYTVACNAPATPGTISGSTNICASSSNTYSIALVSGATSHNWTLPGGWTGTSSSNTISATGNATSGTISVSVNNSCGTSAIRTLAITVNSIPNAPGTINGNTNICASSANTYSIALVSGATSYNWTLPGGWTGTSSSNTISATASSTSGTISVSANNSCGTSATRTLATNTNTIDTSVNQSGISLIANASSAAYQWIDCFNNLPISGAITQTYTAKSNGNYAVIITTNGCTDTSSCFNITSVNIYETNSLICLDFYPNPTNGKINFSTSDIELEKKYKLIIYNVNGMIIHQAENISETDISNQPNGIYLLKIYADQNYIIKKILKQL